MAEIKDSLKLPNIPNNDDVFLINVQRVKSEKTFEICETGQPGIYDDHVVVQDSEGRSEELCLDRAKDLLAQRGYWPLSKNWEEIKEQFQAIQDQKSIADNIATLKSNASYGDKLWSFGQLSDHWKHLTDAQKRVVWEQMLDVRFNTLEDFNSPLAQRVDILNWFDENYNSLSEGGKERLHSILALIMDMQESYPAGLAAVVALGRMEHPKLQTLVSQRIKELGGDSWETGNILNHLQDADVTLEEGLQFTLESLIGDEAQYAGPEGDLKKSPIALITAKGHPGENFTNALKRAVTKNSGWDVTLEALDALASMDMADTIAFARKLYFQGAEGDKKLDSVSKSGRDEAITKFLTVVYMRYGNRWDETRLQIAKLLVDALRSSRGYDYYPSQIARVLAIYPHKTILAEMQAALEFFQNENARMAKNDPAETHISYDGMIAEYSKVIEDLQRGLKKIS